MRFSTIVCVLIVAGLAGSAAADRPAVPMRHIETEHSLLPGYGAEPILVEDQVVVKFKPQFARRANSLPEFSLPQGLQELDEIREKYGIQDGFRVRRRAPGRPILNMEAFRRLGIDRLYVMRLPKADAKIVRELVKELEDQSWVEYAEPVYQMQLLFSPNDPLYPQQWAHNNTGQSPGNGTFDADMDSPEAWDINPGTSNASVAILDTGIQMTVTGASQHPDLAANTNVANGFDYIGNDPFPEDTNGHGTASAGIAAAVGNNGVGVAGVCHGCEIFPFKVSSSVDESNALMQAADNGADTINMSHTFGCPWLQNVLDATEYASSVVHVDGGIGSLMVASAANSSGYGCAVPAAFPEVISAGGTNANDQRIFTYSDYSEIAAGGTAAWSTSPGNNYTLFGGTSSASPFIAGVGALLRSERPDLHVRQLRHTMRLGSDDQVSSPDPPGWDIEMGFGRVNANNSMNLLTNQWIALDRGHYVCDTQITIALQDATAGATVNVSISGDTSGDTETVTLTKVPGTTDYYEGTISTSWIDTQGAGSSGDGVLDVTHDEIITAVDGPRSAEAFLDCVKEVCRTAVFMDLGDCDQDNSFDPGETRTVQVHMINLQTEPMQDVSVTLSSTSPWVEIIDGVVFGNLNPITIAAPAIGEGPEFRIKHGAPADIDVTLEVQVFGKGFVMDEADCADSGYSIDSATLRVNRDRGAFTGTVYNFETGLQGFTTTVAHGSGDLPECTELYVDPWSAFPDTTHPHLGARAWGTTSPYPPLADGALVSPAFNVSAGGGVVGWRQWIDTERSQIAGLNTFYTWDGMVLEAKRTGDTTWTYLEDVTYDHELWPISCSGDSPYGTTTTTRTRIFSGDGLSTNVFGDTHSQEQYANLSQFAGEEVQVRWRLGSDGNTEDDGVWIDTVRIYESFVADAKAGVGPQNVTGSQTSCDAVFDLTSDPVSDATEYRWYRSATSCNDALAATTPMGTTVTPSFSDATVAADVEYYYAVEADTLDAGFCAAETARTCVAGGCCSTLPADPTILNVDKSGGDVLFDLNYSGELADVYRDPTNDPAGWGSPFDPQVIDGSGAVDFQYTDVGGLAAGTLQHFIFTSSRCGITQPPRP